MVEPLKLGGGITYEFDPVAVFEGKEFISLKKISAYTDHSGKEQRKYQNLTAKPKHRQEFVEWLQECVDALKGEIREPGQDDDVPF